MNVIPIYFLSRIPFAHLYRFCAYTDRQRERANIMFTSTHASAMQIIRYYCTYSGLCAILSLFLLNSISFYSHSLLDPATFALPTYTPLLAAVTLLLFFLPLFQIFFNKGFLNYFFLFDFRGFKYSDILFIGNLTIF